MIPEMSGKKKKQLTESEIALKKAEESRKRKNQSDKRLEDEVKIPPSFFFPSVWTMLMYISRFCDK
jgi:hypothetical protein